MTQTVGTSAFGVPRVPAEHRSRYPPIVYLKQVWPQILPIAQRFCSKPMQIPMLFGIALQRAIELTRDVLSPTLSATIAMECAVAMSKVALPGAESSSNDRWLAAITVQMNAHADAGPDSPRAPFLSRPAIEGFRLNVESFVERLPSAVRSISVVSLAIIAFAAVMYGADRREPADVAREERTPESQQLRDDPPVFEPSAPATQEQQFPEQADAPDATPEAPADGLAYEDIQPQLESSTDSSAEIVIPPDLIF